MGGLTPSVMDYRVMPNGLLALTLPPPPFVLLPESLLPPHAASAPLNGMTAAVAIAPFTKVRRSTGFFSVVMVSAFRVGCWRNSQGVRRIRPAYLASRVLLCSSPPGTLADR